MEINRTIISAYYKNSEKAKIKIGECEKMSFSNMLEILQEKNKGKIVLIKLGAFYVATDKDAVLLHDKLNLKCNCFKNNICIAKEFS